MNARIYALMAAAALAVVGVNTGQATVLTDPVALPPGVTVSPIPNGYSFGSQNSTIPIFIRTQDFDFEDGPSGFLFEAVYSYPD
jgi:hypothetical protein